MLNTAFFTPRNILVIGVIALIWHLTAGKYFSAHIQKGN